MDEKKLNDILKKHKKWLLNEKCGERADLRGANLINADYYYLQCPEKGSFIGYKTASDKIVTLEICEDALRSSATTRKCRCSKAKVLDISNMDGSPANVTSVVSDYDPNFIYEIGKIVSVDNFDTDRWNECSTGIHFFITKEEVINYCVM